MQTIRGIIKQRKRKKFIEVVNKYLIEKLVIQKVTEVKDFRSYRHFEVQVSREDRPLLYAELQADVIDEDEYVCWTWSD